MKNTKKLIIAAMCLLLVTGCGQKTIPTLKNGEEVITTLKDDKKISVKDLYNELKSQYGLQTLVGIIDKMILEDKYSSDIEAAKEYASTQMSQLKEAYGDDLLSAIQYYTNYNSLEDYEKSLYLSYFQKKALTDYAKTKISESDIKKYYKNEVKSDIKISHILITANVASDASDEEKTNAQNDAKAKAEEVIKKLNDASDKKQAFSDLAKEYSNDETTKENEGNLGFINVDTLGDAYKDMVTKAYELKDGEYTKEPVKTELGYHVVLRTETKDKASLDEVRDTIIEKLAEEYISKNSDSSIKAMQELRKEYEMDIVDSDIHDQYVSYIQNSLAQLKTQAETSKTKK